MNEKIYEVLKCEGKTGLTVNSRVFKPGQRFSSEAWKWGEESLKSAIENERCKLVIDNSKRNEKKAEKFKFNKSENGASK